MTRGAEGGRTEMPRGKGAGRRKPTGSLRLPLPPKPGRPHTTKKGAKGYIRRRNKRVPLEEEEVGEPTRPD